MKGHMRSILREEQMWLITGCLLVLATLGLAAGMYHARGFMKPFVVALLITSMVAPLVDFQVVRLRWPKALAVATALLVVGAVLGVFCLVLALAINSVVQTTFDYRESLAKMIGRIGVELRAHNIEVETDRLREYVQSYLMPLVTQSAGSVMSIISGTVLTLVFVAFLLAGRDSFGARRGFYAEVDTKIRRYIVTKFGISAITGLLVWCSLSMVGLRMAVVFAILAFVLNFIPSLGSIVATLLPIPIAVTQFDNVGMMLAAVAIPGAVQMVLGNVIEPKVMGEGLELHPVVVLLSLAFWGLLWGPIGMVLAVPITAIIRIVLVRIRSTNMIGNLLAGRLPVEDGG
jgi:AI-2 transport protein TqsA